MKDSAVYPHVLFHLIDPRETASEAFKLRSQTVRKFNFILYLVGFSMRLRENQ